jgi:hypothetical protein
MDRDSFIFCVGSLGVSLLVAMVAFPFMAMDAAAVSAAKTPMPAYEMGVVDVGNGFGELSIEELMAYYVENPPAAAQSGAAPIIRMGGC